jgi:hypothetical protein
MAIRGSATTPLLQPVLGPTDIWLCPFVSICVHLCPLPAGSYLRRTTTPLSDCNSPACLVKHKLGATHKIRTNRVRGRQTSARPDSSIFLPLLPERALDSHVIHR